MMLLKLLALATGISASLIQRQGNSQCAQWCAENFPDSPGSSCTSLAAHEAGPCYQCGPAAKNPGAQILCNGVCVASDVNNCGSCGNKCATGASCNQGSCQCPSGQKVCGGECVDTMTDNANCGSCGTTCTAPTTSCIKGSCQCPSGQTLCGTECVDLSSDNANCGSCGTTCATGASCNQGSCQCPSGQTVCGGECVDTMTDNANCGSCGNKCSDTDSDNDTCCSNGVCYDDNC